MSQLIPVCLLLVVISAAVIAYPAEQAGNFLDFDELFAEENPDQVIDTVPFAREQKRLHGSMPSCTRECAHCAKIHTRYSMARCFQGCMKGRTDYACSNRMNFV